VLRAGIELFTEVGYDRAGFRDIGARAGVDARLIGRYFGSKEKLFTEVVAVTFEKSMMMGPGHNRAAARTLLGGRPEPAAGMLLALRSAANERAAEIMRTQLEGNYERTVADGLSGPDVAGRAARQNAHCSGVQLMRDVMGSTALGADDLTHLAPYLEAALDAISTPPACAGESAADPDRTTSST
jgi:AcrR family transcriptional regulator